MPYKYINTNLQLYYKYVQVILQVFVKSHEKCKTPICNKIVNKCLTCLIKRKTIAILLVLETRRHRETLLVVPADPPDLVWSRIDEL